MPKVRLSGQVDGSQDPTREERARLLYMLFAGGWDIDNANGDELITLGNIQGKIKGADAFVFTRGSTLQELFKAVSVFVGYQTLDADLSGKPTAIMNGDGSWQSLFSLLEHLQELGTIKQDYRDFIVPVKSAKNVVRRLEEVQERVIADEGRHHAEGLGEDSSNVQSHDTPLPDDHAGNVCVFCSASIEDPAYLGDGYTLGKLLAENQLGCVSGAGKTGVMGAVVRGSVDAGGWTGGSNVPHIIELEGLPKGLSSFWLRPDIYTRMEVMIENSDSFVAYPGGAGTVQEVLALLLMKHDGDPLMKGKPVVIFDRKDEKTGKRFWAPFIDMLSKTCCAKEFIVVDELDDVVPAVKKAMPLVEA